MLNSLVTCLVLFSGNAVAQYYLLDDYLAGGNFFDKFSFFTDADPTHGFVQYRNRGDAQNQGLLYQSSDTVYMGVDSSNIQPNGRPSVRITSNKAYDSGLFILDLNHMPGGICGTWPAFWTVGSNWPSNGEIDIIEGVHEQTVNDMTLHTSDGCTLAQTGAFTGNTLSTNCYVNAPNQPSNQGCAVQARNSNSYGAGFNNNGGGVYVMEWVNVAISIWFFPRNNVPSDITAGRPRPSTWGPPLSQVYGPQGCDMSSHFRSQQIVFDTTFCGDWAGAVWGSSSCAWRANSCEAFVANNPSAFAGAYWSINSLKVYQISGQTTNAKSFFAVTDTLYAASIEANNTVVDVPENHLLPVSPHGSSTEEKNSTALPSNSTLALSRRTMKRQARIWRA